MLVPPRRCDKEVHAPVALLCSLRARRQPENGPEDPRLAQGSSFALMDERADRDSRHTLVSLFYVPGSDRVFAAFSSCRRFAFPISMLRIPKMKYF